MRKWWKRDPEGIREAEKRLERATAIARILRAHREENHVGEAFQIAFAAHRHPPMPPPPVEPAKKNSHTEEER